MLRAALFDLDGTLLDSMYVWGRVDELFFARRGMEVPEDYMHSIAGMSSLATAKYTKERFCLPDSLDELQAEWTRDAIEEYAKHVPLKEGSIEALDRLKARGVRLCVVTTLIRDLYEPCLRRNGILDRFDFILTTDQAGSASKSDGRIYRAAAERMGVRIEDCAVFEDVKAGIIGAKAAGMRAYCVIDPRSTRNLEEIRAVADGCSEHILDLIG